MAPLFPVCTSLFVPSLGEFREKLVGILTQKSRFQSCLEKRPGAVCSNEPCPWERGTASQTDKEQSQGEALPIRETELVRLFFNL